MKKTKAFLTLACALLLVVASVMGTLAYLTSTPDAVVNTFTVGDNVAIKLDEAKVNTLGEKVMGQDQKPVARVKENTYNLRPNHEYVKDPTVHVEGGDCYVFIVVNNPISSIESTETGYTNINSQIAANNWKEVTGVTLQNGDKLYIYAEGTAAKTAVKKNADGTPKDLPVFAKFKIKADADYGDLDDFENGKITINAYAVQTVDFDNKTAAQIWTDSGFAAKYAEDNTPATPDPAPEGGDATPNPGE